MNNKKPNEITFERSELAQKLFGSASRHLKIIGELTGAKLSARGNTVFMLGQEFEVKLAELALTKLYAMLEAGYPLYPQDIQQAVRILKSDSGADIAAILKDVVFISARGRAVAPRGKGQKIYVDAIRSFGIVFGIGPAGTGKTYLAMAMAVNALEKKSVRRIILTRPAVEAGESLGFLPGSMLEKINPYLRPLYDALHDMIEMEKTQEFMERGLIEVAPLAFMRGRTLNDSFIILDEAQNTTPEQMKMFLTRLGFNSKVVVTGDITQIDLPKNTPSGLVEARRILRAVEGIKFCFFDEGDVVRHPLVQKIIKAYEKYEQRGKLPFSKEDNGTDDETS
ncbi:MAG: PhoH family protein [Myxococcota bacterium]